MLDLDYQEDSTAQADANFVLTDCGAIIEIQAIAEEKPFQEDALAEMIRLARQGIGEITALQREALGLTV